MSGIQFHETRMGRTFFERDFPELVRQLARMNELLERLVDRMDEPDATKAEPAGEEHQR